MYLDAIVVKVRADHHVVNRPVYISMGVDLDGCKHVLGLWLGKGDEGSKYWLGVLTELRNRGVHDVLIACCDGLTGFSDAIETVWPQATVQTCTVHLIRNSIKYCAWKDRRAVVNALKPMYTAPTVDAASDALDSFESAFGVRYPAIVDLWRRNWERFIPFLAFDPATRKIIYTTDEIVDPSPRVFLVAVGDDHFVGPFLLLDDCFLGVASPLDVVVVRRARCWPSP